MGKDQNERFAEFQAGLIEEYWLHNPGEALHNGYYKYDDRLTVPNEDSQNRQREFAHGALADLATFDVSALRAADASDHAILVNQMEASLWYLDVFESYRWDPSEYNVAAGFGLILNTDYKPLNDRLLVILRRLENVPAYYEAAKANLQKPTLQHTDFAIKQNKGALGVFVDRIPENLEKSTLSDEEKAAFAPKLGAAAEAINGYVSWLEELRPSLVAGGARDFRIGKELYEQKFALDIVSGMSGEELYRQAIEDKKKLHAEMISICKDLWSEYFAGTEFPEDELAGVKQMIDHLSVRHIAREDFLSEIERQMPIIQQYIVDNNLVEIDPTRPLVVRETPEYQRGFAGASVDSPGPYDATANTYYNVTPLDHYTEDEAESYLREYNHWVLQVLNIHEALPGHYAQLVQANKSPSLVKSLFGNGAMIEGWAVYSERMMLESGYGDNEPEMWLMYAKWNLRVVVNTIIDYAIQVLGMSEQEVLDMLINEAFQEQTEATGKWRRATLSQVQLTSYYSGYKGIYGFREELKQTQGDRFDLKAFHDEFLSYGSAPVPVIKRLMLDEMAR
jgi:uncharacterized protein (DUF885 family)|tara:strand:+ start:830 stop:2521 length:1692 start_codon:yes stop_codon:yes gene_type:complete